FCPRTDPSTCEDVVDLSHRMHADAVVGQMVEDGRLRRFEAKIPSTLGPFKTSRLADEGASDHPADAVLTLQDLPRLEAQIIKLLSGDDLLVGRDLKDAVRRRIDNRPAGPHMLC